MWLTLLLPVLLVSLTGALAVLVYSLQKSLGPIKVPSLFRKRVEQSQSPLASDSDPGAICAQLAQSLPVLCLLTIVPVPGQACCSCPLVAAS